MNKNYTQNKCAYLYNVCMLKGKKAFVRFLFYAQKLLYAHLFNALFTCTVNNKRWYVHVCQKSVNLLWSIEVAQQVLETYAHMQSAVCV